jgi:PAS domain S-box-containing protein
MVQDVTERKRVEEALRQSEERVRQQLAELEAIYATTPLGLCVLDTELRFRRINQRLAEINGVPVADTIGRTLQEVVPGLSTQAEAAFRRVLETGETTRSEFRGETRAQPGVERVWDQTWYPLRDSSSQIVGVGVVAEEITARKQAEEQMRASLSEKEILLKEIHHRVKNNIQVISSLLSLQIEHRDDPALRTVLSDVRDRVKSMALVHEQLYSSTNLAQVDLAEYARRLMRDLFRSHGALASKISLRLEAHSVNVGVDVAVPYGLILNELATNALKHAFVGRDSGEILIETHTGKRGEIHLRFVDNGVGFPANLNYHKPRSLGLRLVQMLTDQLNGTLQMQNGAGTDVRLTFASAAQVHADA